mgnify:CR=1 FL=1
MVKLTAAATVSIPRIVIFALTLVYGLAGLFGRDPWKNEDSIGFGVMWNLHLGSWQDWFRGLLVVIFPWVHHCPTG